LSATKRICLECGAKMVRVDGKKIKPDIWYGVRGGKVVKVQKED
jgi:hypothetical protein